MDKGNTYLDFAMLTSFCALTDLLSDRQIPTTLSYVDGDEYYGTQAKAFLVRNPTNTIAYFKDFLGQEYASRVDIRERL